MKCKSRYMGIELEYFVHSFKTDEWMTYLPDAKLLENGRLLYGDKIIGFGNIVLIDEDKKVIVMNDRQMFDELFYIDWVDEQISEMNFAVPNSLLRTNTLSEQNDKFLQKHFPTKVSEYQNELSKLQNKLMDVLSEINDLINKNK